MFAKDTLKTLLAASALALLAAAANATTSCQYGDETDFGLFNADVYTSTDCAGMIAGNDKAAAPGTDLGNGVTNVNDPAIFNISTWVEAGKVDVPKESDDPDFDGGTDGILTMTLNADGKSGTWSVSSWAGIGSAMLVLKGGPNFAAYLLDLAAGLSGEWRTDALLVGNNLQNSAGLSHITLYTSPAPIPLPAAGFLLLGALGGLAAVRRRRRTA
jgi:hypothetical protein